MSSYGKIFLGLAAFAFVLLLSCRVFLGGWVNYLFIPLALFLLSLLASLVVDARFYAEFLSLRTTKHGLNMGAMIVLAFVFLSLVNFLSFMKNQSWDLTRDGSNTLSQGSQKALETLQEDLVVTTYYAGARDQVKKLAAKQLFDFYKKENARIKSYFVDTYVHRLKAERELKDFSESQQEMVSLVTYKDRTIQIQSPLNEQNITAAIVRATRPSKKVIYFLSGHREKLISSQKAEGISLLKQGLESLAFEVKELNFIMSEVKIPKDASVVALIGPRLKIFENEILALKEYVSRGGRLLVAIDPGVNHDLEKLLSQFGVLFRNNYVIAEVAEKLGRSASSALGLQFDGQSSITRPLLQAGQVYGLFEMASELNTVEASKESLYQYRPLVRSAPESFTIDELKVEVTPGVRGPKTLAVEVSRRDKADFGLLVFGDSDFLSNKDIGQGINRGLALNAFSFLASESDLIQIPEKTPSGTVLIMTGRLRDSVVFAGLSLPMMLLMASGFLYFRRKKA